MIHFYHCCFSFFAFKQRLNRVSIRKNVAQFLRKEAKIMSFVALNFCAIICKLHFAQNCAILLFRYFVLRNLQLSMKLHFLAYNCNAQRTDYLPQTLLCNLMHDGTLQIKTIFQKSRVVIFQLLNLLVINVDHFKYQSVEYIS